MDQTLEATQATPQLARPSPSPSTSTTRSTISAAPTPPTSSASPPSSTPKCAPSPPTADTVDSLRVAVLAALNIADELCTVRQRHDSLAGSLQISQHSIRSRAGSLAGMLDEVLEDRKVG